MKVDTKGKIGSLSKPLKHHKKIQIELFKIDIDDFRNIKGNTLIKDVLFDSSSDCYDTKYWRHDWDKMEDFLKKFKYKGMHMDVEVYRSNCDRLSPLHRYTFQDLSDWIEGKLAYKYELNYGKKTEYRQYNLTFSKDAYRYCVQQEDVERAWKFILATKYARKYIWNVRGGGTERMKEVLDDLNRSLT